MTKPGNPYNQFSIPSKKYSEHSRARKQTEVPSVTQMALQELATIRTWDEFVAACEEQKRRRDEW